MEELTTCGSPARPDRRAAQLSLRRDGRTRTVDIHCHISIAGAETCWAPFVEKFALGKFSNPLTEKVQTAQFETVARKLGSLDARLADMDALGIDVQVVSPTPTNAIYASPVEPALAGAKIMNDGIAAAVGRHPDRFVGMGIVPLQHPEIAVAEMRRCRDELGLRGIEISSHVNGSELSDPAFHPFFATAEEMGMLLFLHPMGTTHGQRLKEHYFNNVIGMPLESALAVGHLIFDGVLDRLPGLKICVAHGGGYIPAYWGRMDHAWHVRPDARTKIAKPPSHYLRQLYFDTLVFDRKQLRALVDSHGADHLCLGSDYPFDMSQTDPIGFHSELSEEEQTWILGGTAAKLLQLT